MVNKKHLFIIVGMICILAFCNSFLTSTHPDGLERTAEDLGFNDSAKESFSLFGDYLLPIRNEFLSSALAGLMGVGVTYLVIVGIGKLVAKRKVVAK